MPKQPADYLKEARQVARAAGIYFVEIGAEFKVYRKTTTRPVYLGMRSDAAALCSLVKRCARTA
jgi:hypothetical protein